MRLKINNTIKEFVRIRQRNRCACCMELGKEIHHVVPVALNGNNSPNNLVLLCEKHHELYHLGDLETIFSVLEYKYYLENAKFPEKNEDLIELSEKIKNQSKVE